MKDDIYKLIYRFGADMRGVFTLPDLRALLNADSEASFYRAVKRLVANGDLIKVKRSIYALPDASLRDISARIEPRSYISTDTVLAAKGIIGTVPVRRVQAVKVGRPRRYECPLGVVEHLSVQPSLYFGFENKDELLCAAPEKAFLDACYFTYKGRRLSFDPYSDVSLDMLDPNVLEIYLSRYDDRFRAFYDRTWGVES